MSTAESVELEIASQDGTRLAALRFPAPANPTGAVVIVHGYGEHIRRYRPTAADLAGAGFAVFGSDLRGHGRSGGRRAHIRRFDDYTSDVAATLAWARTTYGRGDEPLFLLGHSMGGLVALRLALSRPQGLAGLILTSPFFGFKLHVPRLKAAIGRACSLLVPTLALPTGLDPALLSHDSAVTAAYAADTLVNRVATARWFTEVTQAQAEGFARAPSLGVPTLFLQAGDDRIADPGATRALFERAGAPGIDKSLTIYPEMFHEILNELEPARSRVLSDVTRWLQAHARISGAPMLRAPSA